MWNFIARQLARPAVTDWLIHRAMRTPYSHIEKDGEVYMWRYWLFNPYPSNGGSGADRKRWQFPISIRIHHIVQPDQDRDKHDHPWNARTIILRGTYREVRMHESKNSTIYDRVTESWVSLTFDECFERNAGDTATLAYGEYHSIARISRGGVWTLFITGKYRGTWGFMVGGVKIPWRRYLGLE